MSPWGLAAAALPIWRKSIAVATGNARLKDWVMRIVMTVFSWLELRMYIHVYEANRGAVSAMFITGSDTICRYMYCQALIFRHLPSPGDTAGAGPSSRGRNSAAVRRDPQAPRCRITVAPGGALAGSGPMAGSEQIGRASCRERV